MCFAPEADAVVGGIIVAVGVDALRHVVSPKQIALAALPLLFGRRTSGSDARRWWRCMAPSRLPGRRAFAVNRRAFAK